MITLDSFRITDNVGSHGPFYYVAPDSTDIKPLAKKGTELREAVAEQVAAKRARDAAISARDTGANSDTWRASEAGRTGTKIDKKAFKAARHQREEDVIDCDLEWTTTTSAFRRVHTEYLELLAHHAPALAAEARQAADHAVISAVTAVKLTQSAAAEITASTAILNALPGALGGEFVPKPPKAHSEVTDDFNDGKFPAAHLDEAEASLRKGILYATRVLEDLEAAAKDRAAEVADDEADDVTIERDHDDDEDDDEADDVTIETDDDE